MIDAISVPWKILNQFHRWLVWPGVRLLFLLYRIKWGHRWRFYGLPVVMKHRLSSMKFGDGLQLRSSLLSNPLGASHPVVLATWSPNSVLEIGENFAMTGGTLCASARITIGNNVTIGANTSVIDTDFHPIESSHRLMAPQNGQAESIVIRDNVFIGMNCIILKGVTIGEGAVIGAGSIVTGNVPSCVVVAGNPAQVVRSL
jgi:acetyltransferase-like isoleucine patch superfamily enzyme